MLRNRIVLSRHFAVVFLVLAVFAGGAVAAPAGGDETAPKLKDPTEALRRDYVTKAQVWDADQYEKLKSLTPEQIKAGQPFEDAFPFNRAITCRFVEPTLKNIVGGMTPKFLCGGGTAADPCPECNVTQKELKVKFGKDPSANPEIYAEVMGTRLLWLLGFKADGDYPVRVTCLNCPADPWSVYQGFRNQAGRLDKKNPKDVEKAADIAKQLGGGRATRSFLYAVIESKFPGTKIKAEEVDCSSSDAENTDPRCGGFSWNETAQISEAAGGAPKAQVDAFRLLAAFMTHADNKPGNQRLVCPDGNVGADGTCTRPFAMIQDIGAGFGSTAFFGLGYRRRISTPGRAEAFGRTCTLAAPS